MKNILSINWWIESSGEFKCKISAPFRHQAMKNNGFIFCYNLLCHCERCMWGILPLPLLTHLGNSVTCTQHSRTASLTVGFAPLNTHRHFSDPSIFVWILKRYFQCILNCLHSSHLNLASHSSSELPSLCSDDCSSAVVPWDSSRMPAHNEYQIS